MKTSKSLIATLLAGLVLAVVFPLHAQEPTVALKMDKGKPIEAGSTVTFTVTLDKAPSVKGTTVALHIEPVQPSANNNGTGQRADASNPEGTVYKVPVTIPVTARRATWHITVVTLGIPSASDKTLVFEDVQFEVREKDNLVLPNRAKVELSK